MERGVSQISKSPIKNRSPSVRPAIWRAAEGYISLKPWRFTLLELVLLTSCVALSCVLATQAGVPLGFCFLVTVICFRTSIIDFTLVGGMATLLTIVFGTLGVALLIIQAIAW